MKSILCLDRTVLTRFFYLGTTGLADSDVSKRIVITNQTVFVCSLITLSLSVIFLFFQNYFLAMSTLVVFFLFNTVFVLNYLGFILLSRIWLVTFTLFAILFHAAVLGPRSGFHYAYFFLICEIFIIFGAEERLIKYSLIWLPPFFLIGLELFDFPFFFHISLSPSAIKVICFTVILETITSIFLSLYFLMEQYVLKKNRLTQICAIYSISEREVEILEKLIEGKTNRGIAQDLFIEEGTVKNHLNRIYKKTQVKNRLQLMRMVA